MYTGQQANPAGYLAHFVQSASVGTDLIYRNSVADDLLHQLLGNVSNVFPVVRVFFQERFRDFFLYSVYVFFPFQFVGVHQRGFQFFRAKLFNLFHQFFRRVVYGHFHLGLADLSLNAADEFADLFNIVMGKENGIQHFLLGNFLAACFYH